MAHQACRSYRVCSNQSFDLPLPQGCLACHLVFPFVLAAWPSHNLRDTQTLPSLKAGLWNELQFSCCPRPRTAAILRLAYIVQCLSLLPSFVIRTNDRYPVFCLSNHSSSETCSAPCAEWYGTPCLLPGGSRWYPTWNCLRRSAVMETIAPGPVARMELPAPCGRLPWPWKHGMRLSLKPNLLFLDWMALQWLFILPRL